jgi:hypothetical protein
MDRATVRLDFEAFHRAHPQVLIDLVGICRFLVAAGVKPRKASIWTVLYRARWNAMLDAAQRPGGIVSTIEDVKNDFAPYYARLIMAAAPDLDGFLGVSGMKEPYTPDLVSLGIEPSRPAAIVAPPPLPSAP